MAPLSLRRLLSGYLLMTLLLTLLGVSGGVYWLVSRHLFHSTEIRLRTQLGDRPRRSGPSLRTPLPAASRYASPQLFVRIYDAQDRVIDQAGGPPRDAPLAHPERLQELRRSRRTSMLYPSATRFESWTMLLVRVRDPENRWAGAVEIGCGNRPNQDLLRVLAGYLSICTALGLTLGASACAIVARHVGEPVESLAAVARDIAAGDRQKRADDRTGPQEVRSLAQDFNTMVTQLDDLLQSQRRFVADASHELKTPLTSLGAMAEILETGAADSDQQRRALDVIAHEVERMSQLVNDLLTLSRLEHAAPPTQDPIDPVAALTPLREQYELLHPNLHWDLQPCPRVRIAAGDWERLVRNLVDNALRYTPAERTVQVRLGPGVALEVQDQGAGIPQESLPRLFERFYRADPSRARSSGGTGLGLAIVHSIVANAGGHIQIESTLGEGTLVSVRLPEGKA